MKEEREGVCPVSVGEGVNTGNSILGNDGFDITEKLVVNLQENKQVKVLEGGVITMGLDLAVEVAKTNGSNSNNSILAVVESMETGLPISDKFRNTQNDVTSGDYIMEDQVNQVGVVLPDGNQHIEAKSIEMDGSSVEKDRNIEVHVQDMKQDIADKAASTPEFIQLPEEKQNWVAKEGFSPLVEKQTVMSEVSGVQDSLMDEKCDSGTETMDSDVTLLDKKLIRTNAEKSGEEKEGVQEEEAPEEVAITVDLDVAIEEVAKSAGSGCDYSMLVVAESVETGVSLSNKFCNTENNVIGRDHIMEGQVTEVGIAPPDENQCIGARLVEIDGSFVEEDRNIELQVLDVKQDIGGKAASPPELIPLPEERQNPVCEITKVGSSPFVVEQTVINEVSGVQFSPMDEKFDSGTHATDSDATLLDKEFTSANAEETKEEREEQEEEESQNDYGTAQENRFSIGDFIWGKIRSHPWWPGQIYDPSNASEYAAKRRRRGCHLVAYFGDGTFAWCDESQLRPFQQYFNEMSKQSNSKNFQNAVDDALEEIQGLLESEMTCSCMPEKQIKLTQPVPVNAGIKEETTVPKGNISSLSVATFEPAEFLEGLKHIARYEGVVTGLELTVVKCRVLAIFRARGYSQSPIFYHYEGFSKLDDLCGDTENPQYKEAHLDYRIGDSSQRLVEKDQLSSPSGSGIGKGSNGSTRKRPHISEDELYHRKKQRSMAELMAEKNNSDVEDDDPLEDEDGLQKALSKLSKKQKKTKQSISPFSSMSKQNRKKNLTSLEDTEKSEPKFPNVSWVGKSISKIASQLTGSPPTVKCSGETFQKKVSKVDHKTCGGLSPQSPKEGKKFIGHLANDASVIEMLSDLCLASADALYTRERQVLMDFFTKFRSSNFKKGADFGTYKMDLSCSGGRTKASPDEKKDLSTKSSCETEKITYSRSRRNTDQKERKRKDEEQSKSPKKKPRRSILELTNVETNCEQLNKENLAAILLTFTPGFTLPSREDLITIFGRFGPLRELEREVSQDSACAQVVFVKSSDAEAALENLEKTSAFGPSVVSYRLRYLSATFRASENGSILDDPPPKGFDTAGLISSSKPPVESPLLFVQKNLETMTSMMVKWVDQEAGPTEKLSNIVDGMKNLLKQVSGLVESST